MNWKSDKKGSFLGEIPFLLMQNYEECNDTEHRSDDPLFDDIPDMGMTGYNEVTAGYLTELLYFTKVSFRVFINQLSSLPTASSR